MDLLKSSASSVKRQLILSPNKDVDPRKLAWMMEGLTTWTQSIRDGSRDGDDGIVSFFHGVNPAATTWVDLVVPTVLRMNPSIKTVSLLEWVTALEKSASEELVDHVANPAVALLDYFRELCQREAFPVLDTAITVRHSHTLATSSPIPREALSTWIQEGHLLSVTRETAFVDG